MKNFALLFLLTISFKSFSQQKFDVLECKRTALHNGSYEINRTKTSGEIVIYQTYVNIRTGCLVGQFDILNFNSKTKTYYLRYKNNTIFVINETKGIAYFISEKQYSVEFKIFKKR